LFFVRLPPSSSPLPYTTLFRSISAMSASAVLASDRFRIPQEGNREYAQTFPFIHVCRAFRSPCGTGPRAGEDGQGDPDGQGGRSDRKSTRLNSSHVKISYAVFC